MFRIGSIVLASKISLRFDHRAGSFNNIERVNPPSSQKPGVKYN